MANQKYKIELTAIDKTKAVFNNVKRGLSSVKGAATGVTKVLGGAALAFGGVATAVALATKQSYDYIDAIGKTSLRTGIAVDSLQAYIIAAQESGSSTEEATKGFEKFARSIGDAERGLKTQLDIFQSLGVELRDASGRMRQTEDILKDTAEGIKNLGSESERATVLANLFGRAGLKFSEIFREGSAGLDSFTRKAAQLGIILDSQIVNNVQQFNDSFNILTNQFNSLKNNVLGAFAPVLNAIVEDLSKLFGVVEDGESDVNKLRKEFKELGENIAIDLVNGIANSVDGFGDMIVAIQRFGLETKIAVLEVQRLLNVSNPIKFAKFTAQIEASKIALENLQNPLVGTAEKIRGYGTDIGKTIQSQISLTGGNEALNDSLDSTTKKLINIAEPLDVYRQELTQIQKTIDQNIVSAFKKAEDALVDFVKSGKLNFKDLIDSIISDLIRLAIRQQIVAPLFNFLTTRRFASDPFVGDIADFEAFAAGVPNYNNGGFTGFRARAGGIDGKGGFPAILHPNETIIDHSKSQQMPMAAPSVNFTIQATDASGFDELLVSRKNQIVAMISQAMNQKGKVGLI